MIICLLKKSLAISELYATITKTYRIVEVGAVSIHILVCQEGSATSTLVAEPSVISLIIADQ